MHICACALRVCISLGVGVYSMCLGVYICAFMDVCDMDIGLFVCLRLLSGVCVCLCGV